MRLQNDFVKLSNKWVKQITSPKYRDYRIANITRYIWKNGTAITGRIEFKYLGQWGTACSSTLGKASDIA